MNECLDRYAVIGNPVAHSRSPDIHALFAAQTGQQLSYERLLAPLDDFAQCVQEFVRRGGKGANVTVPFKLEAYALADKLTDRAFSAGAVNTLKFDSGVVFGDNTDGIGLVTDIECNAGFAIEGKRVLLLGAGGAARGAVLPLLQKNPAALVIANRTVEKAHELALGFVSHGPVCASDFAALEGSYDIVINATSASLGRELPAVPASVFKVGTLAYDMMYGKEPTVFMGLAEAKGAHVRDGLGMLVEQAAESFFVWRGVRPQTAKVFAALRGSL